jgi:hypothetical protein
VNGHPGWLVDDYQAMILEQHLEQHMPEDSHVPRFRGGRIWFKGDRRDSHEIPKVKMVCWLDALAIDPYLTTAQQPVDMAFGYRLQPLDEKIVDALAIAIFFYYFFNRLPGWKFFAQMFNSTYTYQFGGPACPLSGATSALLIQIDMALAKASPEDLVNVAHQ